MTEPSRSATRSRLARIVADSRRHAEALLAALENERSALAANDAEALGSAVTAKHGPVSKLAALEQERADASRDAGFEPGPVGMDAVIGWCDEESLLADGWSRFIEIARDCERLNTTNGAVIRLRRQQVMTGLAILRGGEYGTETYAASGVEAGTPGRRALAEA